MIRDMMRGDSPRYAGWTMDVAKGTRLEAGNADEAIAILEARPDIHVVFSDIQMPGSMDGLSSPDLSGADGLRSKIVATSGFVNVGKDDLPEGGRFLPKPYRPEQVVATLRELTAAA
jgi:CheY-like chemotaxis protein